MNQRERLRMYCARPPRSVLYDDEAERFLDLLVGKTLTVASARIKSIDERIDEQTRLPYLALLLENNQTLSLTQSGIAFAPLFTHTGRLEELPAEVCWTDFHTRVRQLRHELYGQHPVGPSGSTVRVLMCCLAIVDGAGAAGFEVGCEEHELQWHLSELERLAPP